MIKRIFAPLLAALFFVSLFGTLAGCNTIGGRRPRRRAGRQSDQGRGEGTKAILISRSETPRVGMNVSEGSGEERRGGRRREG